MSPLSAFFAMRNMDASATVMLWSGYSSTVMPSMSSSSPSSRGALSTILAISRSSLRSLRFLAAALPAFEVSSCSCSGVRSLFGLMRLPSFIVSPRS